MTLGQKSLEIAKANIGTSEMPKGSNSGPEINIYLRSVGLGPGYAWCMAFVYYCVNKAAGDLEIVNPLIKTGGVMRQWNETKLRKIPGKVVNANVKPGDIMIMSFGKGLGHTGIVESVKGSLVTIIEGNTNVTGEREGYKVCRKQRPISSIHGFIQLP